MAKAMVLAHVATYGWWCPGWGVPAHAATDLTVDHVEHGSNLGGHQVMCRSCNSRKQDHATTRMIER